MRGRRCGRRLLDTLEKLEGAEVDASVIEFLEGVDL
jgi:hypothetical protein